MSDYINSFGVGSTEYDIKPGSGMVGTTELADSAVTTTKLADSAISTAKIASKAVTQEKVADDFVAPYAEDLSGETSDSFEDTGQYLIDSTGGKLSIKSGAMSLLGLRFVLQNNQPCLVTGFRFNGANAVISSQVLTGVTISSNAIASGSNKILYIHCVKGEWAGYGVTGKNNGYLIIDSNGADITPVAVAYKSYTTTAPAIGDSCSLCVSQTASSRKFWLPEEGWMLIELPSSTDLSGVCVRLAWSYKYSDFVARAASSISLSSAMSTLHSGGWGAGIVLGSQSACDELKLNLTTPSASKYYRRVDRVLLTTLTWAMESDDSGNYTFTASISAAKNGGLFQSATFGGMTLDGTNIVYTSTTITSVAALLTALAGEYGYYELATPVEGTVTIDGNVNNGDDFGTNEVLDTSVAPYVTCTYKMGLKDYLRSLPSYHKAVFRVIAASLNALNAECEAQRIIITSLLAFIHPDMAAGKQVFLKGSGSPVTAGIVPDMAPQFYRDYTNKNMYIAVANESANDWKQINNA